MTFWQNVALAFTDIGWVTALCLIAGIIFVIIEMCEPGVGFFGITGTILIIAALVFRAIRTGENGNPVIHVLVLLLLVVLILGISWGVVIYSMRKGWLSRTGFVTRSTAVSRERSEGTEDFSFLLGKKGVTLTTLRPSGTVEIEGKQYDVVSFSGYYDRNVEVFVFNVSGNIVTVKPIEEKEIG